MKTLKILFIDDDPLFRSSGCDDLRLSLEEVGIHAEIQTAETLEKGIEFLDTRSFDLAIVDLRLGVESSGNEVVRKVLSARVIPLIIFSAYPQELEEEYCKHKLIYVAERKRVEVIVGKIVKWTQDGVLDFFSERGPLAQLLREVLQSTVWSHLSRFWDEFEGTDKDSLLKSSGRIAATLIHDLLANSPDCVGDSGEVRIHHGEIYIFDTPRKHLAAGDLLRVEDSMWVVLSPTCDLIPRPISPKARTVLLAHCHDLGTFARCNQTIRSEMDRACGDGDSERVKRAVDKMDRMMRHDFENAVGQFFFLPPFGDFRGGVVDFLEFRVHNVPEGGGLEELVANRILALNREMVAEMATRFGRFMIRLGQSPYQREPLVNSLRSMWLRETLSDTRSQL